MRSGAEDTWIIPQGLERSALEALLAQRFNLQLLPEYRAVVTYMDSFDWRLYQAGMLLHAHHRSWTLYEQGGDLTLLKGGPQCTRSCRIEAFPEGGMRTILAPVLGVRALLPVAKVSLQGRQLSLRNASGTLVLRLVLEEQQVPGGTEVFRMARLFPLGGREQEQATVRALLREMGIVQPVSPLAGFEAGCRAAGRRPLDYDPEGVVQLAPDMSAQAAIRLGCMQLLETMRRNLPGALADLDSEFLHDLRTALQSTRSVLARGEEVFGAGTLAPFRRAFAELARATALVRDLDLCLFRQKNWLDRLHPELRPGLQDSFAALSRKRCAARRSMAHFLSGEEVTALWQEWQVFLEKTVPADSAGERPVAVLANRIVGASYRQMLAEGRTLGTDSPDTNPDRLRDTCKELRFCLEFFGSLYPQKSFSRVLEPVKELQTLLDACHELSVQQGLLRDAMGQRHAGRERVAALGALVQSLYEEQRGLLRSCAKAFAALANTRQQELMASLIEGKGRA